MWTKIILALGVVCCVGLIAAQQQQQSPCTQNFINGLYGCIRNSSMEPKEFLSLINNQTRAGTLKGVDAFKDKACVVEADLVNCGMTFMNKIDEAQICPTEEWTTVRTEFMKVIGQFDFICADPCRQTLLPNLRKCYETSDLDPNLFLSNATMGRGAVIGVNSKDVKQYCEHKNSLMACMKKERADCPDAPAMLRNIGLDIEAMEKGTGILCKHPEVYLKGLDCFQVPTKGVEDCQVAQSKDMVDLIMKAQNTSMEENDFFNNFCGIRVKHVGCDVREWAKKVAPSCNKAVVGLRTEMECGLMPDQCTKSHKSTMDKMCHVTVFFRHEREPKQTGSASISSISLTAIFVFVSHYLIKQ